MGHNYGYETLMTELPTYMKQVLRFSLKSNGLLSSLPYLAMWIFSMSISVVADWMISSNRFNHTSTRKVMNSIGKFSVSLLFGMKWDFSNKFSTERVVYSSAQNALCNVKVSNTTTKFNKENSCLTFFRSIRSGYRFNSSLLYRLRPRFNPGYSHYWCRAKWRHLFGFQNQPFGLDSTLRRLPYGHNELLCESGRSFSTNCRWQSDTQPGNTNKGYTNNLLWTFLNHVVFSFQPTIAQWQKVFFIAAGIYIAAGTFYNLFASGQRQPWDNPDNDEKDSNTLESQHQTSPTTVTGLRPAAITATQ